MANFIRLNNFLGTALRDELLNFAIASESAFLPTTIGTASGGETNPSVRRSVRIVDIGDFRAIVERRVQQVIPDLTRDLRLSPFETGQIEIEMVAHADGGFYTRHIDTFTGKNRTESGDRVISCVYYFFTEPKSFSGGELRLHPLPTKADPVPTAIDVTITNDTLIAFSSWLPHEVLPVSNPSTAFVDSRFSINCWVYQVPRTRAASSGSK